MCLWPVKAAICFRSKHNADENRTGAAQRDARAQHKDIVLHPLGARTTVPLLDEIVMIDENRDEYYHEDILPKEPDGDDEVSAPADDADADDADADADDDAKNKRKALKAPSAPSKKKPTAKKAKLNK